MSKPEQTLAALVANAQARLAELSASPRLEAEVLLAHALQKSRSYLRAWPEQIPDSCSTQRFAKLLERRLSGEPLAYLIGYREFWSLELAVSPATLIPRPETELLVELALERLPPDHSLRIADLGTGSGAIALAIAKERPKVKVLATDSSSAALAVAKRNASNLEISNAEFRLGDWCAALNGERFDLIVSNPPYLAISDPHLSQGDLRFEPHSALVAGPSGLEAIQAIIAQAQDYLHPQGWLLLEHGYDQSETVAELLHIQGFEEVADHCDAAGIPRAACGRKRAACKQ